MSRKQAICYVIILSVLVLALLALLAIFNIWYSLLALLILVLALGLAIRYRPQMFSVLRRRQGNSPRSLSGRGEQSQVYMPNLILVNIASPDRDQIVINKPEFLVGRDAVCDCSIANTSDLSRIHAIIRYDSEVGASYIIDNNSRNGTFVNGVRLLPGKPRKIESNDFIQIGTLRFVAQSAHF